MWNPATTARALGLALLATPIGWAQAPRPAQPQPQPARPAAPVESDRRSFEPGEALPEPEKLDNAKLPPPPNIPADPYLLTRDAGPFMVMAHTFRGPQSTGYAVGLAKELRDQYHLPAYVFHLKIHPSRSNINGVAPTANPGAAGERGLANPRVFDEAAVLVGNCKTVDESLKLLDQVKKIYPKALDGMPYFFGARKGKGLSRAFMTTNPYKASQELYASRKDFDPHAMIASFTGTAKPTRDPIIRQMNEGPQSILKCPGPYTMVVADFTGQSITLNTGVSATSDLAMVGSSKLVDAAEDAQRLVDSLGKVDELKKAGYKAYVYHDRTSSKVTIGSFQNVSDPNVEVARRLVLEKVRVPTGKYTPVPDGKGGHKNVASERVLAPMGLIEVPKP